MRTAIAIRLIEHAPGCSTRPAKEPTIRGIPLLYALPVPLTLLLTGCTEVRTRTLDQGNVTMTQQQFAAHVERVFRYHNRVMSDLIDVNTDRDFGDDDALSDAEEQMDEACEPLNEVVSEEAVARESSFWTRQRLPEAVPACEEATQHLEKLLHDLYKSRRKLDVNYGSGQNPR
jgi:hypothetical protein